MKLSGDMSMYAWTNKEYLSGEIKAVMLTFHGLGYTSMKKDADHFEMEMSAHGVLIVFPYYGAWSWMNKNAVNIVDEIVSSIYESYNIEYDIPIISFGASMGGLSALVYSTYAKKTPRACFALCPVCDLVYHSTERNDLPRTLLTAFGGYEGEFIDAVKTCSPVHIIDKMPKIPYMLMHGNNDPAVSCQNHSSVLFEKLKNLNFAVDLYIYNSNKHCNIISMDQYNKIIQFVLDNIEK